MASYEQERSLRLRVRAPRKAFQEAVKDEALVGVTQKALAALDCHVAVKPEKPSTNKEIRITQTLEPALAASPQLLRVCGRAFPELRDEALAFPAAAHDDLLDALSSAYAKASSAGPMSREGPCDPGSK